MGGKTRIFSIFVFVVVIIPILIISGTGCFPKNFDDTGDCIPEKKPRIDISTIESGYTYFIARLKSDTEFSITSRPGARFFYNDYVNKVWIVEYPNEATVARVDEILTGFPFRWSDYPFELNENLSKRYYNRLFLLIPGVPYTYRVNGFALYKGSVTEPGGEIALDKKNLLVYLDNLLPGKNYKVYIRKWVRCKNADLFHPGHYPYPVPFTFSTPATSITFDVSQFFTYRGTAVSEIYSTPKWIDPIFQSIENAKWIYFSPLKYFVATCGESFFRTDSYSYYWHPCMVTDYFYWGSGSNKSTISKIFTLEIKPVKDDHFSLFLYLLRGADKYRPYELLFEPYEFGCCGADDVDLWYGSYYYWCRSESCDRSLSYCEYVSMTTEDDPSILWRDSYNCQYSSGKLIRGKDVFPFLRKDSVFHRLREIVFNDDPLALVFEDGRVMFVANGYKVGKQSGKWGDVLDKDKAFEKFMNGYSDWVVAKYGYLTGISPEKDEVRVIEYSYDAGGYMVFKESYSFKVSGLVRGGIVSANGSPLILERSGNLLKVYLINFKNRELTLAGSLKIGLKGNDVRMVFDGMFLYLIDGNRVYKILVNGGDLSVVSQKNISGIPEGSKVWAEVENGRLIISWFQDVSIEDFVSRKGIVLSEDIEGIYRPYLRKLDFVVIHTDEMKISGELSKLASIYYPAWEVTSPVCTGLGYGSWIEFPNFLGYGSVVEAPLFNFIDDDHIIFPGGWLYEIPDAVWREARKMVKGAECCIRYPLISHPDPLVLKVR